MDLVDRNIRQRMLPFVWNPSDDINRNTAEQLKNSSLTTIWSFREKESNIGGGNNPKLGITPEDYGYFSKDISNKLVFGPGENNKPEGDLSLDKLMNYLPSIQIREYTQDTRLDMILSIVDYLVKGYKDGSEVADNLKSSGSFSALSELITYDLKHIHDNKYWKTILDSVAKMIDSTEQMFYTDNSNLRKSVLDFIYSMYYRLLSTTTTNVYVLPYTSPHVLKGNGQNGFDIGYDLGSKMDDITGILKLLSPSITMTTTPMWKGMRNNENLSFDITFSLFNDTKEKAITNFIFVNTLLPQNMPTQYAVFSQPPSLYDIKIEGGNRLFMCAGTFNCTYKGVMRKPSQAFLDELKKHVNVIVGGAGQTETEEEIEQNEYFLSEYSDSIEANNERIEELKDEKINKEQRRDELTSENETIQTEFESGFGDKTGGLTGMQQVTSEGQTAKEIFDSNAEEIELLNSEITSIDEEIASLEAENESLEMSKEKPKENIADSKKILGKIKTFIDELDKNNVIRIPDVYEITMSFKSLLPNNFNNFLFQFTMNANITDKGLAVNRGGIMSGEDDNSETIINTLGEWVKSRSKDAETLANKKSEINKLKEERKENEKELESDPSDWLVEAVLDNVNFKIENKEKEIQEIKDKDNQQTSN